MKNFLRSIFILLSLLFLSQLSYAQDFYLAGFSLIGSDADNENYPVARELFNSDSKILNDRLNLAIKKLKRTDINLIGDYGLIKNGNAVALAYGLQKESFFVTEVENQYQTTFEVTGEIYAFDFSDDEHKLIASYPTGKSLSITSQRRLTEKEIHNYIENMYLPNKNTVPFKVTEQGASQDSSVFDAWVERLETVKIDRAKKPLRLQIRKVTLDDPVIKEVDGKSTYIKNPNMLINETARNFERDLSMNQNLPVLPYNVGRAIGKEMRARFAGQQDYEIKIPEPDYVIDILVREFKKSYIDEKFFDTYIHGAYVTIQVIDTGFNKVKLESKFKYVSDPEDKVNFGALRFPKSYKVIISDDWPNWMGAQKKLFSLITQQISAKDDKVLNNISTNPQIKDVMNTFNEIVTKCR